MHAKPEDLLTDEVQEPKELNDLGWVARVLNRNQREMDDIKEFRRYEINKIGVLCDLQIDKLQEKNDILMNMARGVMTHAGYSYYIEGTKIISDCKKYKQPGLGSFKFSISSEKIDDSDFQKFSVEDRIKVQEGSPNCFITKTTTTPSKTLIKKWVDDGFAMPSGFKLVEKTETFKFDGE